MTKYKMKKVADHRTFYEFKEKNRNGEILTVEITECYYDNDSKGSLPFLWKEHGYTNKLYTSALFINCYCTNEKGECREKYNPTIKLSEDKKRMVIDFDNLLEVSKENKKILLNEIYKRFIESKEV